MRCGAVEGFLDQAFAGEAKIRMFKGDPVRWFCYLISHEANHRGQSLLAHKQAGLRMPQEVALQGLWGKWISGVQGSLPADPLCKRTRPIPPRAYPGSHEPLPGIPWIRRVSA